MYVIYKYTNITNGKCYVGLTKNLSQRQKGHVNPSSNCTAFRNAIQKYGIESFARTILEEHLTIEQANTLELHYIQQFNTVVPYGYNLRTGGGGGHVLSEESKQKISATKQKHPRKLTEDEKTHLSRVAKLRGPKSPETKAKMSAAKKDKAGYPCTDENKHRLSTLHKNKVFSVETREKISLARKAWWARHKTNVGDTKNDTY